MIDLDPRVRFSLERTFLSWSRTSIALMGFGFLVARFSPHFNGQVAEKRFDMSLWIGVALICMGIFINIASNFLYNRNVSRLEEGKSIRPGHWTLGRILSLLLTILSLIMVIHLTLSL